MDEDFNFNPRLGLFSEQNPAPLSGTAEVKAQVARKRVGTGGKRVGTAGGSQTPPALSKRKKREGGAPLRGSGGAPGGSSGVLTDTGEALASTYTAGHPSVQDSAQSVGRSSGSLSLGAPRSPSGPSGGPSGPSGPPDRTFLPALSLLAGRSFPEAEEEEEEDVGDSDHSDHSSGLPEESGGEGEPARNSRPPPEVSPQPAPDRVDPSTKVAAAVEESERRHRLCETIIQEPSRGGAGGHPDAFVGDLPAGVDVEQTSWFMRFAQGSTYKTFMDSVASVLPECAFQVVDTPEFKGIAVENIDSTRACLLQGRLSGQVRTTEKAPQTFCVRMSTMMSCLRSIAPSYFVELWSMRDSTDVWLHIYEPRIGTHVPTFRIKTLARTQDCCSLEPLDYSIFIELDLQVFRNTIKTAREHKADTFTISVYTPRATSVGGNNGSVTNYFVISYEGEEVSASYPYESTTETTEDDEDGSPLVIKATDSSTPDFQKLPPLDELETVFTGKFGSESVAGFIKGLDRHALTLRLGPNRPIVLDMPLGSNVSFGGSDGTDYLKFIVAPRA